VVAAPPDPLLVNRLWSLLRGADPLPPGHLAGVISRSACRRHAPRSTSPWSGCVAAHGKVDQPCPPPPRRERPPLAVRLRFLSPPRIAVVDLQLRPVICPEVLFIRPHRRSRRLLRARRNPRSAPSRPPPCPRAVRPAGCRCGSFLARATVAPPWPPLFRGLARETKQTVRSRLVENIMNTNRRPPLSPRLLPQPHNPGRMRGSPSRSRSIFGPLALPPDPGAATSTLFTELCEYRQEAFHSCSSHAERRRQLRHRHSL